MKPDSMTTLNEVKRLAGSYDFLLKGGSDCTTFKVKEAMNIFEEYSRKENGEENAGKLYNVNAIFSVYVAGYIRCMKDEQEEERQALEARKRRLAAHFAQLAKDLKEKRTNITLPKEEGEKKER